LSGESSPEWRFLLELLQDGQWHDGLKVAREVERTIPPGQASRYATFSSDDKDLLVRTGRRNRVRELIGSGFSRKRFECDRTPIGKEGWSGAEPWRIRDLMAGYLTIGELADALDLTPAVIRTWVRHDYVPWRYGPSGALVMFSPADVEACRRVAAAYPGKGKHNWPRPPRSLWENPLPEAAGGGVELKCPHCHQALLLNLDKS
jgi:hypothetical protein